ncbi:MAG: tRNA (adenosine(37)-N6)-threonylcarbamoyltransferase complex dimerization subunit type 1 TsaB [Lachnospiraceae bacterium]|jgi:tRNA threonylcarbamoyladenosine biosynthesis protein TsaB|nr:tRNA (adenosine(37)-N6)-threonylcarbamoyltransferase complex dimerization subunit type 1 TsaB [Lachnospiraceae bacterium]
MKILAIEASGPVAGCALLEDGVLTAEYSVQYKKKHSQSLVPMLDEMKRMLDLQLSSIDFLAVTEGPGSFTGLRIGAATVKGLGLALDKPVLPVPTVDSLACNLFGTDRLICPLMDARRQQVYTGIYENDGELRVIEPQCVVALSEITQKLNALGREVIFLGDGVPVNEAALGEQMTVPYLIAPAHVNRQRAASTAVRAAQIYAERADAALVSADDFRPEYLRIPQAERERGDKRNYKVFV